MNGNKPIDIFICSYLRDEYTEQTIKYIRERTKYPYRLWLLDNGENSRLKDEVDFYIGFSENIGIHPIWQIAFGLAESEYFITTDNDIFVPDLIDCTEMTETNTQTGVIKKYIYEVDKGMGDGIDWLTKLVKYMDERPDYGAISLHPHVFIGIAGEDPNDPEDVKEAPMAGAVARIMRRKAVYEAGGWERVVRASRNHEERTICSRLHDKGYKVGRTTRVRAYHPFGGEKGNWGYPKEVTPEMQGHNPDLKDYVTQFDNQEAYDPKTWLPKT